jgi:hypothetical protein
LTWHAKPAILTPLRSIVLKGPPGCPANKRLKETPKVQTKAATFINIRPCLLIEFEWRTISLF